VNAKVGLLLELSEGRSIWIDREGGWPSELSGRRLRVTGVVTRRADLPVFIPEPGEFPPQGTPVPPGTDLEKARIRYVLSPVRWTLLEDAR
jgi:hypothetical protein